MKSLMVALALSPSPSAFAVTAPTLKGNINITAEMLSPAGRSLGIATGALPVQAKAEVGGIALSFAGFNRRYECLAHGEEQIPGHNETAPCLKEKISWVPSVMITASLAKAGLRVGDQARDVLMGKTFSLPSNCILNLEEATVVGTTKPSAAPAALILAETCVGQGYTRVQDMKFTPRSLKGATIEAVVDLMLGLTYSAPGRVEIVNGSPVKVEASSLSMQQGTMGDFGGFGAGSVFAYYDRVTLQ